MSLRGRRFVAPCSAPAMRKPGRMRYGRARIQGRQFLRGQRPLCKVVRAPDAQIGKVQCGHQSSRLLKQNALGMNHRPAASFETAIESGPHIQFLAMMALHFADHLVVTAESWIGTFQPLSFMHGKQCAAGSHFSPASQRLSWRRQMRKKKATGKQIHMVDREWPLPDVVLEKLEVGMIGASLSHVTIRGFKADGLRRLEYRMKQCRTPAGTAAEVHCELGRLSSTHQARRFE